MAARATSTSTDPQASGAPEPARRRAPYRKAEVVREAILGATIELLSERPLGDLTVRDIAARAGVQHSLVTRHFGSKDALVAQAVATVARAYTGAVTETDDAAVGYLNAMRHLGDEPFRAFVLAAPASDRVGSTAAERFPGYNAHLDRMVAAGAADDLRTRVAAGMVLGMVVAWNVMEGVVVDAAGIDPMEVPEARALAEELVVDVVTRAVQGT